MLKNVGGRGLWSATVPVEAAVLPSGEERMVLEWQAQMGLLSAEESSDGTEYYRCWLTAVRLSVSCARHVLYVGPPAGAGRSLSSRHR